MAVHTMHVGIFTATRWELNAVRRAFSVESEQSVHGIRCVIGRTKGDCRFSLFQTGIGSAAVRTAVQRATTAQPFDLLVSSGFACALGPAAVGDLLIGTEVVPYKEADARIFEDRAFPCSPEMVVLAMQAARSAGVPARVGRFVTVPRILTRVVEKRVVAEWSGAIGADMESAVICAVGEAGGVPVLVARAVSDLLEEDLPLDFNQFLRRTGWIHGVAHCLAHPGSLHGLNRMRLQGKLGADRLTCFFVKFFDELGS